MAYVRDFKGIFIPREIWLHPELLPLEKFAWAEIHSLFNREKGGCYASNEYLAKYLGITPRYAGEMISKLKKLGLLVQISFDGRTRVIEALMPPQDNRPDAEQTGTPVPGSHACHEHSSPEPQFQSASNPSSTNSSSFSSRKKEEKKIEDKEEPCSKDVNKKALPVKKEFGKYVRLSDAEYAELIERFSKEIVDAYIEKINDYIASHGLKPYKDYAATIRNWVQNPKNNTKSQKPKTQEDKWVEENKAIAQKLYAIFQSKGRADRIKIWPESVYCTARDESIYFTLPPKTFKEVIKRLFGVKEKEDV